jgi:hypothetical protein
MKTKSLLLLAAAASIGATTAFGAVSSNIVGYTKLTLKKGFNLVGNTLDNKSGNKATAVFTDTPENSAVFSWTGKGFNELDNVGSGVWVGDDFTLAPGTAVFVQVPADATITLVGEVLTGQQDISLVKGFNFVASKIPQAGKIDSDLGFTALDSDAVFQWNGKAYVESDYIAGVGYLPSSPSLAVGEGVVVQSGAANKWSRNFTVN